MIGYGLKKYASELGFTVNHDLGYGEYKGYLLTFQEGDGWKSFTVSAVFDSAEARISLQDMLLEKEFKKKYRIRDCDIIKSSATVMFADAPGTMKKFCEVVDIVCDHLISLDVKGVGYCPECGLAIDGGAMRVVLNGGAADIHSGCAERIDRELSEHADVQRSTGSVLTGTIGAIIGGIVGAIPWALLYLFGYISSLAGLLIGFCAHKGYDLLHGKNVKIKLFIVIVVSLVAVVGAEYVATLISVMQELKSMPEFAGADFAIADIMQFVNALIINEPEVTMSFGGDILMGWLFAILGLIPTIRGIRKDTKIQNGLTRL